MSFACFSRDTMASIHKTTGIGSSNDLGNLRWSNIILQTTQQNASYINLFNTTKWKWISRKIPLVNFHIQSIKMCLFMNVILTIIKYAYSWTTKLILINEQLLRVWHRTPIYMHPNFLNWNLGPWRVNKFSMVVMMKSLTKIFKI